ncbi:hypothetical protein HYQ44_009809 [Verticillium longisporum]|nr:hypothetical protein HYQ44_009809 [Verticillium longisporum]
MGTQVAPVKFAAAAAIALSTIITAKHILQVYTRISAAPRRNITEVDVNPASFLQSVTVTQHVNPGAHPALHDCRHMDVSIPEHARSLTDQVLLAAFVRGFFGGKVFAPERAVLKIAKLDLLNYPSLKRNASISPVWHVNQLAGDELPLVTTILFGAFQISDSQIHPSGDVTTNPVESESSVDFVFGSSQGNFSGTHQFSILRTKGRPERARVRYAHISCNPNGGKLPMPDFMAPLHNLYAMLLFREAVGEVKRRLEFRDQSTTHKLQSVSSTHL